MEHRVSLSDRRVKTAALMIGLYGLAGALNDPQWFLAGFPVLALGLLQGSSLARIIALAGTGSLGIFSAFIFIKGAIDPGHQVPRWFLAYFGAAALYWLIAAILLARSIRIRSRA